jgi:hydroxymethylbilane synthase
MGARIGTSAVRRSTQLACIRPDLQFVELRGNVITRIEKLAQGNCNAILVATAGLRRLKLDLKAFHVLELDPTRFIPAPGQGALAVQVRGDSPYFSTLNRILNHEQTAKAVTWERGVLKVLGGGCGLPLGVYARHIDDRWELFGFWGGDIHHPVWSKVRGPEETA